MRTLEEDGVVAAVVLEGWADHLAASLAAAGVDPVDAQLAQAEVESCRRVATVLRSVAEMIAPLPTDDESDEETA